MLGWIPARTWVFAVGVIEGSWPQEGRRDAVFMELLLSLGVPRDHLVFLRDTHATPREVENRMKALLSRANPGDLAIIYFSGHGTTKKRGGPLRFVVWPDGDESHWPASSLFAAIESSFPGAGALLFADC